MKHLLQVVAGVSMLVAFVGVQKAASQVLPNCNISASSNSGVVLICPQGDGDPLTSPVGGGNCQISVTVMGYDANHNLIPIPGIPATDMWLVGCSDGLLLCGGSAGSSADAATDAQGHSTFSNEPAAGGCDTGLYVVVQGDLAVDDQCHAKCLPIAARSPDYKSASSPCGGDILCPDGKMSLGDYSWFYTHYPTTGNPNATYLACADYAAPLGSPIGLADFTKFAIHYTANHKCPI